MGVDDLDARLLAPLLGDRPLRSYPALLSTDAAAQAWARAGAATGAVVVADYQASPRGRGGIAWQAHPGMGLGFSLVVRPDLAVGAEGWLYVAATEALADVLGGESEIHWPDEILRNGSRTAVVSMQSELGPTGVAWGVVSVLVEQARPPRGPLLARTVTAIEQRLDEDRDRVLARYRSRCATFGRRVRARLMPLGPTSPAIEGVARDAWADGSLAIETDDGRRRPVRPQDLGALEGAST